MCLGLAPRTRSLKFEPRWRPDDVPMYSPPSELISEAKNSLTSRAMSHGPTNFVKIPGRIPSACLSAPVLIPGGLRSKIFRWLRSPSYIIYRAADTLGMCLCERNRAVKSLLTISGGKVYDSIRIARDNLVQKATFSCIRGPLQGMIVSRLQLIRSNRHMRHILGVSLSALDILEIASSRDCPRRASISECGKGNHSNLHT